MKKPAVVLILLITLLFSTMPASVYALSGAGTESDPYLITNAADLANVNTNLSGWYKLTGDIVLTTEWTPIGSNLDPFVGVFDGDGYTISGLNISLNANGAVAGLFGYSKGQIKNLTVKMGTGINVSANQSAYVGGIVANNIEGTITNCHVEGNIVVSANTTDNTSNVYVGMIAGKSSGPVKYSGANGSVTATVSAAAGDKTTANPAKIYAGGLIGLSTAIQEYNISAVDVTATASSAIGYSSPVAQAGGLVGENTAEIISTYAVGNVTAIANSSSVEAAAYAGGLIGKNSGTIEFTNASGNISAQTDSVSAKTYAGGLIGYNTGNVSESFATGTANSEATTAKDTVYAGGLIGLSNGVITKCYAVGAANSVAASINTIKGGLVGYTAVAATDSYYLSSPDYIQLAGCGTAKTEEQLKLQSTYTGWNFDTIWNISEAQNSGYPYLIELSNVDVVFADVEYTYDGTEKTITASDIGSNVTVEYKNNKATEAGVYNAIAIVTAQNYGTTIVTAKLTILPKKLQVKGLKANDKEFDNTTAATLDDSQVVLEGIVNGDDVQLDTANMVARFQSKNVGDNIKVNVQEVKFKGADAGNYTASPVELSANILEGSFENVVFDGAGTKLDPYIIYHEDELNAIRGNLNAHFRLANNIELKNNWLPIGRLGSEFTGSFDGNGFIISGVSIAPETNYTYSGLFGYNKGKIENLTVAVEDAIYTNADRLYVGAIAGCNAGTISNCTTSGSITTNPVSTYIYIGGIAGINAGTITYSNTSVNINARGTTVYAGGVVGENNNKIETTGSTGTVQAQDSLAAYVGGFTGNNAGAITNCYSTGNSAAIISDTGFDLDVGGFAGRVEGGTITNSYSAGLPSISIASNANVLTAEKGGFTAYNQGLITGCYYDKDVSGMTDADKGMPKTTAELKTLNTFSGWDFDIWRMESSNNDGYPYIKKLYTMTQNAVIAYAKDSRTITVTAYTNIVGACLIAVSFNAGALVDICIVDDNLNIAEGDTISKVVDESFEIREGGSVKIMLWENLTSIRPLCSFAQAEIR